MSLDFYQIIYNDEQEKECYPFAKIHRNPTLTVYFENDIIRRLVPESRCSLIGVASWRLRKKRQDGWTPLLCGFAGKEDDLSEEKIMREDFDIAVLTPKTKGHQMLHNARKWHGEERNNYAWENAINELKKIMFIPEEVKTPIYENHFIARKEIYHEYILGCLAPCIEFMSCNSLFFVDSGYAQKKERTQPGEVERYRKQTGRNDWPIAPFVLERLFSIWINDKSYKIINL